MNIICLIEYEILPEKMEAFTLYARNWGSIIPACGGKLLGYYTPYEGTNYQAFGIIGFESLADYEAYRHRLKSDSQGKANFTLAREHNLIAKERRTFLNLVPGTLQAVFEESV